LSCICAIKGRAARYIAVVRRILNLAARYWRDAETGRSWLETAPLFRLEKGVARKPYPISWEEQKLLISELTGNIAKAALFMVNTGLRDQELCSLRWDWQVDDDLSVLPEDYNKNGRERFVVLNSVARSVLAGQKDNHPHRVFPRSSVYTRGWKNGRERSANRYQAEFGESCPYGFRNLRVHDLRHTFAWRLRFAGCSNEDRKDLLGHKNGDITTHYSQVEIERLREMIKLIETPNAHKMPTLKVVLA
jgi:integrase